MQAEKGRRAAYEARRGRTELFSARVCLARSIVGSPTAVHRVAHSIFSGKELSVRRVKARVCLLARRAAVKGAANRRAARGATHFGGAATWRKGAG